MTQALFNFCGACGAPTKQEPTGRFSTATGEPTTKSVCSRDRCHTEGHVFGPSQFTRRGFFCETTARETCLVCGYVCTYVLED